MLSFLFSNLRAYNTVSISVHCQCFCLGLADVFTSWPPFRICLSAPRIELLLCRKAPHRLSVVKQKRLGFQWESYIQISRKFIFEDWSPEKEKTHLVRAIATVEPEVSVPSGNFQRSSSLLFKLNSESRGLDSLDDSIDMEEKKG